MTRAGPARDHHVFANKLIIIGGRCLVRASILKMPNTFPQTVKNSRSSLQLQNKSIDIEFRLVFPIKYVSHLRYCTVLISLNKINRAQAQGSSHELFLMLNKGEKSKVHTLMYYSYSYASVGIFPGMRTLPLTYCQAIICSRIHVNLSTFNFLAILLFCICLE